MQTNKQTKTGTESASASVLREERALPLCPNKKEENVKEVGLPVFHLLFRRHCRGAAVAVIRRSADGSEDNREFAEEMPIEWCSSTGGFAQI